MHRRWLAISLVVVLAGAMALSSAGTASANVSGSLLETCSRNDMTTGGGWILPGGHAKRSFGFEAGIGPGAPVLGRLVFVNHAENERLNGVIISYAANSTNTRAMMGAGEVNEETVLFLLQVTDNSSSGAPDLFSLSYATSEGPRDEGGPLGGGNIQIHPKCS